MEEDVEFIDEDDVVRINFDWEFDEEPLNLKIIEIEMQPSGSDFGYIIINNINKSKTVRVDKLDADSNAVCVKRGHVGDIDDISDDCDDTGEYIVECPGSEDRYDCNINNNTFIVSGITRSAVMEFEIEDGGATCTPSWTCNSWSSCVNNQRTRICTDLNNCGTIIGKPLETETCVYKAKTSWMFIVIISVLAIAIIIVIIAIVSAGKKRKGEGGSKPRVSVRYGPSPPGTGQPQQWIR